MLEQKATYGIIGDPVEHSLSPVMHNTAFMELGVDAEYKLFPLREEELQDFFYELREESSPIFGLNVTVPYKEAVIPYLDSLSPFADKVKAVNTIVISEDRSLIGQNTDGPGFLSHLAELDFNPQGKRIAVLGAGGTARAIISVLCLIPERPQSIKVYNRTAEKLNFLLDNLREGINIDIIEAVGSIDDLNIELADCLINTTSLGLREEDPCLIDEELLHNDMLVYDVVYNPIQTKLLRMAEDIGAMTANGLGMLFYQGVLSLQHWADTQIDDDIKLKMREALEEAIQ